MELNATIEKIEYETLLVEDLQVFDLNNFDINDAPTACLLKIARTTFAISKWVSPKRTRSYPYERVYNTLGMSKKITVIPIVKDEGQAGDRDYLQWDTVSMMSLLDVFVIFAYYNKADKANNKITNQQFDNDYVMTKINEIKNFHSSALHWNLSEIDNNFDKLLLKVKASYQEIEAKTGVKLYNFKGIDNFRLKLSKSSEKFKLFSREKAAQAQAREVLIDQPKEALSTATKAKLTITNFLGGEYYFTVDEVKKAGGILHLIEAKHTKNGLLPSKSDIKDGLLKLILYCNFATIQSKGKVYQYLAVLKLTAVKIKGSINSKQTEKELNTFLTENDFTATQKNLVKKLFQESTKNKFLVQIEHAK
jgi:hypothetical protein